MKWRHRKNSLPVTGKISHAFSRLFDEYTPKKPKHLKTRPEVTELIETEEFSPDH